MYSLKHLLLLNLRLRIFVGGLGLLAFSANSLEAQNNANALLAEVSPATGVASGAASIAALSASSSTLTHKKTIEEILNTPLNGRLSLALINRIEDLPKEKLEISARIDSKENALSQPTEVKPGELARALADHWKDLLITLVAHEEKTSLEKADRKVEQMLSVSEKIGYAMIVQEGIDMKDSSGPSMEARLQATEALIARYVHDVMTSRRNETWWQNWRDAWNRGLTRIPEDLIGQWSIAEDTGANFAQATIADQRCTLIWQERAGGKIQKIDIDVMRVAEGILYADESDSDLRYALRFETEYEPILTFDVPGQKADTILKLQLRPDW